MRGSRDVTLPTAMYITSLSTPYAQCTHDIGSRTSRIEGFRAALKHQPTTDRLQIGMPLPAMYMATYVAVKVRLAPSI